MSNEKDTKEAITRHLRAIRVILKKYDETAFLSVGINARTGFISAINSGDKKLAILEVED